MPRLPRARQPKEPKERKVVRCYHCNYATKIKSNLKKHIVNVHVLRRGGPREKEFNCPMCQFRTTRAKMMDHYSYEHNVSISKSCHTFLNLEDFRMWKSKVEKDEASRYVVLKGVSKLKTCHVWYYRCHRDGFFNSKGTGKRNIKVKGTNKINGCCPSEMKVMEDKASGKVQVHFVKTHFGHSQDLNRLPLLKEDKDKIAEKLALKIPLSKVLDEIQNSKTGDQLERIHLVTRKDVLNIASSYKLKNECVRRSTEAICAEMDIWVKDIERETSVVRFYKTQGELSSGYPQLASSDFVLIVFNDVQLEYLKFYGSDGICVDRTHQRSQHDFELTTVLVTDELRQGFPCVYMLSNRSDLEVMTVLVKVIANYVKCPIYTSTFMSDVAEFYLDAWCNSMPVPTRKLYSTWHVDRAWRKLLMKIKNADKRAYAYKIIRSLALERDRQSFEQMLEPNIRELKCDVDTRAFAEAFEEEFSNNWAGWAHCFRDNSSFTNSTHLETMHKHVKNAFFHGKKAKRLDKSMADVMKLIRDKVFDQSIVSFKGVLPEGVEEIRKRHEACMNTLGTDVIIEKIEHGGWKVHCLSQVHDVVEHNLMCPCSMRCEDCRICVHSYRCSCYVGTLEWHICQHVHYVGSTLAEQVTHVALEVQQLQEAVPVHVQVHHIPQVPQHVHVAQHVVQHQPHQHRPHNHVPQHVQVPQQANQVQHVLNATRQHESLGQIQHAAAQVQTQLVQHTPRQPVPQPVLHEQQVLRSPQQGLHSSQQIQHVPQQVQHPPLQAQLVQHRSQQIQHRSHQVQHSSHEVQLPSQEVQHPSHHQHQSQQAQHVSSQTVNGSDDDDDRSMEVLHICETNVARELEDLIFKQFSKSKPERDSDLTQAKNDALKLVQDIFDAVETRAQLDIFTNAILPVLPTITAMKYSGCTYK